MPPVAAPSGLVLICCSIAAVGCGSVSTADVPDSSTRSDGAVVVDAGGSADSAGIVDAAALSSCAATRAQVLACGDELTCGASGFDAWCAAFEARTASVVKGAADVACRRADACDPRLVSDCQYRYYVARSLTAAQADLVRRFCLSCEPTDLSGCEARAIAYDTKAGPDSVTDVFLAAWESSDELARQIAVACTGASPDGGAAACAKAFGRCAGGVYIDAIPDCPASP